MEQTSAVEAFCQWLYDTSLGVAVRESAYLFPWSESVHVLALALVVGSISIVDLRLLGLASRNRRVTQLMRDVLPVTWVAFTVAALTGFAMFASNAVEYSQNTPFRVKLVLLALAGLNMAMFHVVTNKGIGGWDELPRPPTGARIAGALSLTLWIGIIVFGRWIGFTIGI